MFSGYKVVMIKFLFISNQLNVLLCCKWKSLLGKQKSHGLKTDDPVITVQVEFYGSWPSDFWLISSFRVLWTNHWSLCSFMVLGRWRLTMILCGLLPQWTVSAEKYLGCRLHLPGSPNLLFKNGYNSFIYFYFMWNPGKPRIRDFFFNLVHSLNAGNSWG